MHHAETIERQHDAEERDTQPSTVRGVMTKRESESIDCSSTVGLRLDDKPAHHDGALEDESRGGAVGRNRGIERVERTQPLIAYRGQQRDRRACRRSSRPAPGS